MRSQAIPPRFAALTVLFALFMTGPLQAQAPAYEVVDDGIPVALTTAPGNAERGKALLLQRERANCLKCHSIGKLEPTGGGKKGPALDGIGAELTKAQLRLTVAEPTRVTRDTEMPNFHKRGSDEPKLTAQEVEDIVAFLGTLRR